MLLPEKDTHFTHYKTYQKDVLLRALPYIKNQDQAIDIGAHVGFWAINLCQYFREVVCFEPVAENYNCLISNVPNVKAHLCALGAKKASGTMINPKASNSGAWELRDGRDTDVYPLDFFELRPSFIKIDVQGSERNVLKGAEATIRKYKPVVVIEIIANDVFDFQIISILRSYGLQYREMVMKNVIMS